VQITANLL